MQVYSLTVDNFHWKEHTSQVEGEAPSPRGGHSACAMPVGHYVPWWLLCLACNAN